MPIKIKSDLPACKVLENENIFVMTDKRAIAQDIRPLKIAIVNLMPTKVTTETQLLRLLGNTPLQIEISLVHMANHISKNVGQDHLEKFYINSTDVFKHKFDGMIITGAPVEQLDFEQVDYWKELCDIMDYARTNVYSTLYICWGAQAGLYHHFGIPKYSLDKKGRVSSVIECRGKRKCYKTVFSYSKAPTTTKKYIYNYQINSSVGYLNEGMRAASCEGLID